MVQGVVGEAERLLWDELMWVSAGGDDDDDDDDHDDDDDNNGGKGKKRRRFEIPLSELVDDRAPSQPIRYVVLRQFRNSNNMAI